MLPRVFNLQPMGSMQPRVAMKAAQHKIVNLLKTFFFPHKFLLEFLYLMCGTRQLFFFQCGPETPKTWTPLQMLPPQRLSLMTSCKVVPPEALNHLSLTFDFLHSIYSSLNYFYSVYLEMIFSGEPKFH